MDERTAKAIGSALARMSSWLAFVGALVLALAGLRRACSAERGASTAPPGSLVLLAALCLGAGLALARLARAWDPAGGGSTGA